MTPKEFSQSLQKLGVLLITSLPQINEKAALNASSLVKNRVVNTGAGDDGYFLGMYEDTPYKKYKEKRGNADFVNLNDTGQMMRDIGVVKTLNDGVTVKTSVGAKDTKNRKGGVKTSEIAEGNADRYGNFLSPNKEEVALIEKEITREVSSLIKKAYS